MVGKCQQCGIHAQLFSPFDDRSYGQFCDVCMDGKEGDIVEREEYDSLSDEYDY